MSIAHETLVTGAAVTTVLVSPAIERTPLYFGVAERSLFGWYHAPAKGRRRTLGIVVCPPLGHEYINSHRSLRHLTDQLAIAGLPALRFDYHGTGDSTGRDEDADRVPAWLASIQEAVKALRSLSRCTEIGLVGVRMGATLAALVSSVLPLECLVVWAPCVRGRTYVRELKALQMSAGNSARAATNDGDMEAGGFVYTEQTQKSLSAINIEETVPDAARVLIALRDDLTEDSRLRDMWLRAKLPVEQRQLPGYVEMFLGAHNAVVPQLAIGQIVNWIAAGATATVRSPSGPRSSARVEQRAEGVDIDDLPPLNVRESIVRFGSPTRMFGILSEPLPSVSDTVPAIVISNAGSTHHVGSNRLYVSLARALSNAGFRCLRFDLPGLGDSVIDDQAKENDPYPADASAVVAAAMAAVEQRVGAQSFVVAGLCSGAHTAFHAGLELGRNPIAECLLINPLAFYYKPGMSLDEPASQHAAQWQQYMKSMRSLSGWLKLVRGDTSVTRIIRALYHRVTGIMKRQLRTPPAQTPNPTGGAVGDDLRRDLNKIVRSGRKLTFVFARFDPGQDILMTNAGDVVKQLRRRGDVRIWSIDNANHTFGTRRPRREMIESVRDHLVGRYLEKRR